MLTRNCRFYRCALAFALTVLSPVAVGASSPGGDEPFSIERTSTSRPHGTLHYGYLEAIFLNFEHFDGDQPVAERLFDDGSATTVLRADDASQVSVGPRITVGRIEANHRGWEVSYFGAGGGKGSRRVNGENDLAMVGSLALGSLDFYQADRITIESQTRLHSLELSRTWYEQRWSLLAGFRYLRIEDDFRLTPFDSDTGSTPPDFSSLGNYSVGTENDLFGLQSGIRHKRRSKLAENLLFDIGGKAGIYGNSASQNQSIFDFGGSDEPFPLRQYEDHQGQVAFVGDASANVRLPLTSRLEARAGYNLLWVEGVALASDQLEFDDILIQGTSTEGGGLFHGASVGLMFHW
jgi:hypothetical protein